MQTLEFLIERALFISLVTTFLMVILTVAVVVVNMPVSTGVLTSTFLAEMGSFILLGGLMAAQVVIKIYRD